MYSKLVAKRNKIEKILRLINHRLESIEIGCSYYLLLKARYYKLNVYRIEIIDLITE